MDNIYLQWIDDNPNIIFCSFRAFSYLGTTFMGLSLIPGMWCPDNWLYGIDDTKQWRYQDIQFKKWNG